MSELQVIILVAAVVVGLIALALWMQGRSHKKATAVAQKEADAEKSRKCLDCRTTMEKKIVEYIVIDKCPHCGGVWLDKDELDKIIERTADDADSGGMATGMVIGMTIN